MQLTALGLNMHKACARGLILQFPFGANTMVQAMYCLYRLRQSETVVWNIVKMAGSFYDDWQELRMLKKFADQVRIDSAIPDWVKGDLRAVCAYELMRQMFGAPYSRYA